MHPNLPYWISTLYLQNVRPFHFLTWLSAYPDIQALLKSDTEDMLAKGIPEKYILALQNPNWAAVEKDLAWAAADPCRFLVSYEDSRYPNILKEMSDPPLLLFVRGNPDILNQDQIAIVGARRASPPGLQNAHYFAHDLAKAGLAVTSGLALGIDGASHRGALRAKGKTIGVAGTGLANCYPPSHKALVEEIIQNNGAIISEFPLETSPQRRNFPRRNRIISGLSRGVLIVEALLRSGSLITAQHALEQGRDVFAIPGSIHHALSRGCHHLIRQGAKLVETPNDILEEFGISALIDQKPASQDDSLNHLSQSILAEISYEITPIDVITSRSGLTTSEVSSILLILELNGYIQSIAGGYIRVGSVNQ